MNEGSANSDWNPIWDVRTGRFDGGWSVEMQIPFKSLRYRPGARQIWGVQLRRSIRRKNEWAHLTLIPQSAVRGNSGSTAIIRVSRHGTLVGLEAPEASRNIEIKPYGISGIRTDRASVPPVTDEGFADAGLDIKYGVTENLTADVTFNTDFAQVEVDEQQVNLTRFQLFFPEKRDFFLEGGCTTSRRLRSLRAQAAETRRRSSSAAGSAWKTESSFRSSRVHALRERWAP